MTSKFYKVFTGLVLCLLPILLQAQDSLRLGAVVRQLEKKWSQVHFMYNFNQLQTITLPAGTDTTGSTLETVLKKLKQANLISYRIDNNAVSIAAPAEKKADGQVHGRIIDEENGGPVPGAVIKAGNTGAAADGEGLFAFQLPVGIYYTVEVSSMGYNIKLIDGLTVKENSPAELNVTLKRKKGQLSAVTVRGTVKSESLAALYIRQKNNAAITDGISSEQISRTPDKNIGESLKRIAGLSTMENKYVVVRGLSERYNGSMLNGQLMPSTELNRKQFSFDIIPANIVDNVTVIKTITPDQSAEFGGGLVNVNTREIPAEDFFTLTIGASANDQTTGKEFRSLQLEGKEYLASISSHRQLFGRLNWKSGDEVRNSPYVVRTDIGGSGERWEVKDLNSFANNWSIYRFNAAPSFNGQLSAGKTITLKNTGQLGLVGSLSYRNTLQTQDMIMTRNGFEYNKETFVGKRYSFTTNLAGLAGVGYRKGQHTLSFQTLYLRTLDQHLISGTGMHTDNGFQVGIYELVTQTSLWQNVLRGEHGIGKKGVKINWNAAHLFLDRKKPDNHNLRGNVMQNDDLKHNEYNIETYQSDLGTDRGALRYWSRALESDFNWNADVIVPFATGKVQHTLKTGFSGWRKHRRFYVLNSGSHGFAAADYPDIGSVFTPERAGDISFARFSDDFDRNASLHALYAMFDQRYRKFRFVWGLRTEYYDMNAANQALEDMEARINNTNGNTDGSKQFDFSSMYNREPSWRFFPSANLTYSLTPKINLRAAYSQSIIRPDLREMSLFQEYDFELGGEYGSSLVKSTTLENLDFRVEFYPAAGEIISASVFRKNIDYPMEIYKLGQNRIYQLRNNKSAINTGVEVEIRKSLSFIHLPIIRNITLYGNFTWLDASVVPMAINYNNFAQGSTLKIEPVEVLGKREHRPQTGASNYIYNAGFYFDYKWLSLSSTYNYVTNRMFRADEKYQESLFERTPQSLDAQLALRLFKQKTQLKFNVSNLLNSYPVVYRNGYPGIPVNGGVYGRDPTTKEMQYSEKDDVIDYRAKPGRTLSFTITYNFK